MSDLTYPYASATDGATVTTGNSGHTGVAGTPPNFEFRDGYRFIQFGLAAGQDWVYQDFAATDTVSYADVVYVDTAADGALETMYLRNASGQVFNVLTHTTRLFTPRVASTTVLWNSSAYTLGTAYKRQFAWKRSTGQVIAKITPLAGGTALLDQSTTGANLGAADLTRIQWGDLTTAPTIDLLVGRIHIATGADALDGGALKLIEPYTNAVPAGGDPVRTHTQEIDFSAWTDATSLTLASQSGPAVTVSITGMVASFVDSDARTETVTLNFSVVGPGGSTPKSVQVPAGGGGGPTVVRGGPFIMLGGVLR